MLIREAGAQGLLIGLAQQLLPLSCSMNGALDTMWLLGLREADLERRKLFFVTAGALSHRNFEGLDNGKDALFLFRQGVVRLGTFFASGLLDVMHVLKDKWRELVTDIRIGSLNEIEVFDQRVHEAMEGRIEGLNPTLALQDFFSFSKEAFQMDDGERNFLSVRGVQYLRNHYAIIPSSV
ncbi:hypothetical protein L7F22_020661 [Adiantum nelumboides]|nr:hypothetical protein [Adiantum nelumboides]